MYLFQGDENSHDAKDGLIFSKGGHIITVTSVSQAFDVIDEYKNRTYSHWIWNAENPDFSKLIHTHAIYCC